MARDPAREVVIRKRIGEVVALRAVERGISPDDLGRAADIDDRQMARALRGDSGFSFASLERVAHVLGWSLGELMFVAFPPNHGGRRDVRSNHRSIRRAARDLPGESSNCP